MPMETPRLPVDATCTLCFAKYAMASGCRSFIGSSSRVVKMPASSARSSVCFSTSWKPPRALTEPATAKSESRLTNSLPPSRSAPYFSRSSAFMAGISVSGDSMMPFVSAVSGKIFASSGAKRASRSEASLISSGPNVRPSFAPANGTFFGFTQQTSFALARSATTGACSIHFSISITFFLQKVQRMMQVYIIR